MPDGIFYAILSFTRKHAESVGVVSYKSLESFMQANIELLV